MTRILVVEDETVDQELVRRCLEDFEGPLEVSFAADGVEALEVLARRLPDLVLTDLRMPRIDGLELVRRIHQEHPLVPVVLMTARGSEQIAVEALRAGAASYVPKDVFREDLVETLHQVLEVAEAHRHRTEMLAFLVGRETRFELPNDIGLIGPLVAYVQESLERMGFGNEGVRTQIGVALMEGVANAMVRGNLEVGSELRLTDRNAYDGLIAERQHLEPYASRRVTVTVIETERRLRIQIRDEGPGFDPATVPDPTSAANLLAVSGRGIMLMRTFMDEVRFNERGNEVQLTKEC